MNHHAANINGAADLDELWYSVCNDKPLRKHLHPGSFFTNSLVIPNAPAADKGDDPQALGECGHDIADMAAAGLPRPGRLDDGNRRLRKWEEMKNFDGKFAITEW